MKTLNITLIALLTVCCNIASAKDFNFQHWLFGDPVTLSVSVTNVDTASGLVELSGVELRDVSGPFTWDWGDGNVTDGWFPQEHTYEDRSRNYFVQVTSHYTDDTTDSMQVIIRFVMPDIEPVELPPELAVTIPDQDVDLGRRIPPDYDPPEITHFGDEFFTTISRSTVEYVLSAAALIQMELTNNDVFLIDDGFRQVLLRDDCGGMYSIWFTDPVGFASGDHGFLGDIGWSSFFHEMGHNVSLNCPAEFFYGGKIDGYANCIYSESMAQIYQHTTAYILINNYEDYNISDDVLFEIRQSAISSMQLVRNSYDRYVDSGMNFTSWDDPETDWDDTFDIFMTIAYKFFEHAENNEQGYRLGLKRMMELLQVFDQDMQDQFDQENNTAEADTFRATLMATAISHAFAADKREEFRDLNFPISDQIYEDLLARLSVNRPGFELPSAFVVAQNYPNPFNHRTVINYRLPSRSNEELMIYNIAGQRVRKLVSQNQNAGFHSINWDGTNDLGQSVSSGIYFYRFTSERTTGLNKMILMK